MDKKTKKILIIVVALVILVIIIMSVMGGKNKDKGKETENIMQPNTSEKLNETKGFEGLSFSNIKFENGNGVTELKSTVTNTTDAKIGDKYIYVGINILDKDGKVLSSLTGQINALEPGETTTLSAAMAATYKNIYDIQFVELEK